MYITEQTNIYTFIIHTYKDISTIQLHVNTKRKREESTINFGMFNLSK